MPYSWEEIRWAVERNEEWRLRQKMAETEVNDGHAPRAAGPVRRNVMILQLIGAAVAGIHMAVMAIIFNYLLFVWILHVSFDGF